MSDPCEACPHRDMLQRKIKAVTTATLVRASMLASKLAGDPDRSLHPSGYWAHLPDCAQHAYKQGAADAAWEIRAAAWNGLEPPTR